ncbi:MAG TPA: hypothetical protein VNJ03_00820 [Vicinamibacterales bacterium]|nr:hypothetical protein [Vicinamibacterales bacterium]
MNRCRSATAERLFCKRSDLDVRSAGTSGDALVRVNGRMLAWADEIFIMDASQRTALDEMFPGHPALQRLVCLDIPDHFAFLQPELVRLLTERAGPRLKTECGEDAVRDEAGPAV